MATIAVIGAGLAGLVVSRELAAAHHVTVFEKSRGIGGRMATRRAEPFQFDHGAQFFTARTPEFQACLEPLIDSGAVADWPAVFAELDRDGIASGRQWSTEYPHFVGVPGMNAVAKALASDLDIRRETAVRSLSRKHDRWLLTGDRERQLGEFDWLVVTTPAPQAAELLSPAATDVCQSVSMDACFALLLGLSEAPDLPWQAALVHDADISWISVDSSKPGRPDACGLVVHSTNAWANAHLDDDIDAIQRHLSGELNRVTGINANGATHVAVHRWRYANAGRQNGADYFLDPQQRLGICGDWFVRGRVEGAFTSANALAGRLAQEI